MWGWLCFMGEFSLVVGFVGRVVLSVCLSGRRLVGGVVVFLVVW